MPAFLCVTLMSISSVVALRGYGTSTAISMHDSLASRYTFQACIPAHLANLSRTHDALLVLLSFIVQETLASDLRTAHMGNPLSDRLVLAQNAQVQVVSYAPPKKHYLHPPDTRYLGVENLILCVTSHYFDTDLCAHFAQTEVSMLIVAPSGLINATVTRK
ncbi:hypothetical protein B0H16DRAFT_1725710 [Mycena metata]|uniref:Uncharacterized protein n=1 Tax=Mycena metata TaxID=1033252 RepID=A0AAD7N6R7_9AGAR|nr:hypothetical protein B0H16DRAFT_1725710 [Mycena metata]